MRTTVGLGGAGGGGGGGMVADPSAPCPPAPGFCPPCACLITPRPSSCLPLLLLHRIQLWLIPFFSAPLFCRVPYLSPLAVSCSSVSFCPLSPSVLHPPSLASSLSFASSSPVTSLALLWVSPSQLFIYWSTYLHLTCLGLSFTDLTTD